MLVTEVMVAEEGGTGMGRMLGGMVAVEVMAVEEEVTGVRAEVEGRVEVAAVVEVMAEEEGTEAGTEVEERKVDACRAAAAPIVVIAPAAPLDRVLGELRAGECCLQIRATGCLHLMCGMNGPLDSLCWLRMLWRLCLQLLQKLDSYL